MAAAVHCLSSSDDEFGESLPDLGVRARRPVVNKGGGEDLVDLTLSSDLENEEEEEEEAEKPQGESLPKCTEPLLSDGGRLSNLNRLPGWSSQAACKETASKVKMACGSSSPTFKKLQAEKAREKREARREQQEAKRRKQEQAKEAAKAKREEKMSRLALKPGECLKHLVVEVDRALVEAAEGSEVISHLHGGGIACRVVEAAVPCSITFLRLDPLSREESRTEEAVIILTVKEFVTAVRHQVYGEPDAGSLCYLCGQWQAALGASKLALVVCGIEEYLRKQKSKKQQNMRSAVSGGVGRGHDEMSTSILPMVTRADMEISLVAAQMECGLNHRLLASAEKVAVYIQQVAKAVAETPFKLERGEARFSWYAEGSSVNSVKVDKNGVGLLKLWHQQLRQFNNVGVEVAQAVASQYPSPQALVQAYMKCRSVQEAEHLLADIRVRRGTGPLSSDRRVGPELSKKIHLFLTSKDPDTSLAHT